MNDGGRGSLEAFVADEDESQFFGTGPACDSSVFVGVGVGVGGAGGEAEGSAGDVVGSTAGAELGGVGAEGDVDEGEAVDGYGGGDGEEEVEVEGGLEGDGFAVGDGDEVESIEGVLGLVDGAGDVLALAARILVLGDLSSIAHEVRTGRRKGDPAHRHLAQRSLRTCTQLYR